jgi:hypothetical protein
MEKDRRRASSLVLVEKGVASEGEATAPFQKSEFSD